MNNLKVLSKLFLFENTHRVFNNSKIIVNFSGSITRTKKAGLLFILFCTLASSLFGQAVGDYRSVASTSWSALATWQRCNSIGPAVWAAPTVGQGYPGQNVTGTLGSTVVTIQSGNAVTLDISPAISINSLVFADATAAATTLTITGRTLNITGAVTFGNPSANAGDQTLTIGTGILNCASISMPETGANNEILTISISTGTISCSGSITMLTATAIRNAITATGAAIINVGGDFSGGTFTASTSTVTYNGAGAQNIGSYTYFNLATATGGIKTFSNAAIAVGGTLAVNNSTLAFTNAAAQAITVTGNLSGNGTIDMSSGSQTHTLNLGGATNAIGTLTTAAVASTINYNSAGAQTVFASPNYRNLTISVGGTKTIQGDITINNDLTVTASTLDFGGSLRTMNVIGNLSGTGTISMIGGGIAHVLNLSGANNTINTFTTTAGSGSIVNYNRNGDQQVFTSANYRNLTISVGGIKTFQGALTVNNDLNISGGTLNLGTGAWTHTVSGNVQIDGALSFNGVGIKILNIAGNLSGTGAIDMSTLTHTLNLGGATNTIGALTTTAVASVINYNRAGSQTVFISPNYRNLTFSGGGTKTLQGNTTVGNALTLTLGIVQLGNFDLIIATGATASAGGVTNMIATDGTGQLKKVFPAVASAFTFPVGDITGSNDYSPTTINFTANNTIRTIGLRVTDTQHPNDGTTTNYISRYWSFTDDQAGAGTYTYTASFNHSAVVPVDLAGANGNMRVNRWDGTYWNQYNSTWPTGTSIQAAGLTQATAPLNSSSFTGRVNIGTYTWNQPVTGDWQISTSWTPSRLSPQPTDILIFDNIITTATNVPSQIIGQLILSNNSDVSLQSAAAAQTLTIAGNTGIDLDIPIGSTLQLSSAGANQIGIAFNPATSTSSITGTLIINPNTALNNSYTATNSTSTVTGTIINNGGTISSTAANLLFSATGIYNHARNGGAIPTANWDAASSINITGTTATGPTGVGQTFGMFTINCSGLTAPSTIAQTAAVIIQGDLNITGTSGVNLVTYQLAGFNLTVNGSTNINSFGVFNDNAVAGANLFVGPVIINANGLWTTTNNPPFTFRGGLTNYGTMSATGTGAYTFNTNAQAIEDGQPLTINNIVTTGITLTNRNTLGLTASTITGTGNFTNGDVGYSAILNLTGGPIPLNLTAPGTLDLSTNLNTVNYNGAVPQTISAYNFYNLTSSSTGTRTLANAGTIGIFGTFTPGTNVYTPTGSTVNFNGTSAQNIPAFTFNNLTISGNSTKTLTGAVTVGSAAAGLLNLNSGILELDGFNLTFLNTAATPFTGVFSATNMISTNGAGYVQRTGAAVPVAANYLLTYPVGSGGYYTPMTISSIAAVFPTYIRVKAVPIAINPSYIKKYWDVQSNAALTNVTATFNYDPAELSGASFSISYSPNAGISWQNPPISGAPSYGLNSFTITGNSPFTGSGAPFNGWWTMGYRTYYSYQTGDWNTPSTWTSDPSGTTQIGTTVPGVNDNVVILSGRTVSLSSNIVTSNLNITINEGGFLDLSTFQITQPLQTLSGQGTLKLASVNFPTGTTSAFTTSGGGTTEYNNTANFTLPVLQTTYNNLTINTGAGVIATQMNNLTLSGNLYVEQGIFQINDNASVARREISIAGNLTVDATGEIAVGTGNTNQVPSGTAPFLNYYDRYSHRVVINGNFTNSGKVRFTNLGYPVYSALATNGFATVYFQGLTDNTVTCDGQTDFYNLVLDKGTDQTYKLTINPSAYDYFRLFGANYSGGDQNAPATPENPNIYKALWIRNGSLILSGFSVIPSLTESDAGGTPNGDYFIPVNGALVLDNPNVIVLITADNYQEINAAYGLTGGSDVIYGIDTDGSTEAMSILGTVQVNDGYLSTRESAGFVTWNYASGQLIINGGVVDSKQLRTGGAGTGKASYKQTGGLYILRGRFQRTPAAYSAPTDLAASSLATLNTSRVISTTVGASGTFSLTDPANVFIMEGGTMRIYDVIGSRAFDVFSSAGNIKVTGGTLELVPTTGTVLGDAANWDICSYAPFSNITIDRLSSATVVRLSASFAGPPSYTASPLVIYNNLTLNNASFNANSFNVFVGGNFSVSNTSTYTPGTNWTIFNGTGNQTLSVNTAATLAFKKLKVDKAAGTSLTLNGTQSTISVADSLMILKGTLADGGKTISFTTSGTTTTSYLYNSGVHSGVGKILMADDDPQIIDGDGNGIFQNLELFNTDALAAPISLAANTTINGVLTLSNDKLFNINTYNLKLNSTASIVNAGVNRYIQTSGTLGDGGLTRVYSNSTPFIFPVGAASTSHATPAYTPATIGITGVPTAYGSISVSPVGYEYPTTTNKGRSLTYFWRVSSSGFTLGSATVTSGFTYAQSDVITGANITEDGYISAYFDRSTSTWTKGTVNDVDETNNIVGEPGTGTFLENVNFIDGAYTAGDNTPTDPFGVPTTYYSRQSGAWTAGGPGNYTTWSTDPVLKHTGAAAVNFPGANDIVVIGNGNTVNLTANAFCASLQIASGSTLDVFTWTGSIFSMVTNNTTGNGLFRLTTTVTSDWRHPKFFVFPAGDFTDFNVNKGTTEFYDIDGRNGILYILPNGVTSYGNLILTAFNGDNLIFPNTPLVTIYGDLTCSGNSNLAWICMSWSTPVARGFIDDVYNPIVEKTVRVKGNMLVNAGTFEFMDEYLPQHLIVDGNVTVGPNGWIDVNIAGGNSPGGAPQANTIAIGGSLINNSLALLGQPGVRLLSGTYYCNATFQGSTNASITGTSPSTIFNKLTVDKGTTQSTTLTLDVGGTLSTPVDNWLTLKNGTFKFMRTNPNSDFTISQGTAFTIPSTSGLYIDYSNTGNRNILIANAATGTNDMMLNGKLTLIKGNVYVGQIAAPNNDNDIEYSGSGASAIEVQGGTLVVNGQIRRNLSSTVGVLSYSQSGGTVTINGNNQSSIRAKLEVCNTGSAFNMSNGTLTLVKGGGTTFGDLYLRPAGGSITGGDIIFTQIPSVGPVVDAVQSYILESNIALNNLTITGKTAATARNATVTLMVNPLTVNGNFTLTNANSILTSNNRNITVNGGFSNSGTYNYGTNTTTFSGGTQTITGSSVTNFYDLVVSPVTSLTPNNSFTVNRNLTINSGILTLTNKKVTLLGNLGNNGSYTDDNITGGISLSGAAQQQITGTGAYGRLELNNNAGARLNNSISLQNNFDLTLGILNINQYELSLGQSSIINGAPFSITKMIVSDGVATSEGLRKFFGVIAAPTSFTFPVGVSGKYTPAQFTINTNATVGSINVIPINSNHPAVDDPLNVLNYYWKIASSGISNFDGKIVLQYISGDVKVTGINTEADYVAAELLNPGTYWSKASPGPLTDNVDETLHQITFNYLAGTNNISGDYTAGTNPALPDEVPSYKSNKNGDWTDETIWDAIGASPACPIGGPNGFNVIVDHDVTTNVNYCFAYQTTINGKLRIVSPTFGHNLGTVDGTGTIYLEGPNLPAGTFDQFLDCANGGTIEYGGSGNYTIIASLYNSVPNLYFTGTGTRTLPNKDLTICNRLKIDGPTLDNSVSNKKLTIQGTMERYNTGAFRCGTGANATVSFEGSALQTVGGPLGDFSGTNVFNNLEINNSYGLSIGNNGIIQAQGILRLTNGLINTTSTNRIYLFSTATVVPAGGSSTSFVNGPLYKYITPASSFLYPIGKGIKKGHNFTITNTSAISLYWLAEYFNPNPTYASLTLPLEATNTQEYWSVNNTSGARTAKVKIGWDPASDLTPTMTVNGLPDMRVAQYSAGSWVEQVSTTSGDVNNGDVATTNNLTISTTPINYTTASFTTTKPKASLNPAGPICGAAGIPVSFSSFIPIALPYTLDYTLDGIAQPTINVLSLPYTLPTPTPGAYKLTNFTYHNVPDVGVIIGVVNPTIVNAYATPPTASAGIDQSWCSVSGTTLVGNNPAPYSGLWTKVSGIGGTILTPTAYNSGFNGTLGNTYTLRWTISNATCTSFDDVIIAYNVAAQRPSNFTAAPTPVCKGSSGVVYTVPAIAAATFNWSYSGNGASIGGTPLTLIPITGLTNSVTINFDATATSGTLSVTATNACGTSIARSVAITLTSLPTITLGANPSVCRGNTIANLPYSATTGIPNQYSIVFGAAAITAGFVNVVNAALPATPITITVPAGAAAATYTANLYVRNSVAGCSSLANPISITVNPLPTITLGANPAVCQGITTASLSYSATSNSPDLYNIDFDASAEGVGFIDVVGSSLPLTPIPITIPVAPTPGTYNAMVTVQNSTTGCLSINYNITITILPLPTSTITGLATSSPICEGDPVQINIVLTGQPPFNFTVQDDHGNSWAVNNLNVASGSTYVYSVPTNPIWLGPVSVSTTYVYTITGLTDNNLCAEAAPAGSATVVVYKIPVTGPQYHVPNSFGL